MSKNVIELNGKRYDAISGAPLGQGKTPPVPARPVHKGKAIDGIMPRPAAATTKTAPEPKKPAPKAAAIQPSTAAAKSHTKPARTPTATAARRTEHSKTLMRVSVHRPEVTLKPAIKPQAPAEMAAKPASAIARKHSVAAVDQKRLERAVHTPKHTAITRFHHPGTPVSPLASTPSMLDRSVPVIPVTPPPVHLAKTPQSAGGARAGQHQLASHDMPLHPNIFEQAMHRATSHQEPAHKVKRKRHRRLANSLAGVAAFLVIAGFISYLNMPALELKVASVQAGFRAALPDYQPTGYALAGGVKRNGGTVSMSFRSGASMYTITQQASDWNSQTLLDSTLGLGGEHAAVQKDGRTIYIYDDGANAAWVSGGVRYDLAANTELNKHDIVSIATSL